MKIRISDLSFDLAQDYSKMVSEVEPFRALDFVLRIFLFFMQTTLVLEIGNPWLKMALFKSAISTTYLKAVSAFNIAELGEDAVAEKITSFLKEFKLKKPQSLIVSFSRDAVTLRNLRIPSAAPAEIDDMIKLHVGRQVPYAKEEIVSGWRITGKDAAGYSKVMLAIVHRESIRRIFKILEKGNFYTDRVELSSDGVLSWLIRSQKSGALKSGESFIVLDIDFGFTDFIISTSENILFSRVINLGVQQLSDEAKWAKFLGEMKQTLVISQGEEIAAKPSRIYVSGALERFKDIQSKFETEFNLPVSLLAPLLNLPQAKEVVRQPRDLLETVSFSPLLGLGLDTARKKINFVLPEAQIRRALKERSRDMIFFGSGVMYLVLLVCGVYLERVHNVSGYVGMLKNRYQKIAVEAEDLNEKMERVREIRARLDAKSEALSYLLEISRLLPPEIVVTNISFAKDDRLDLKGRCDEMSGVFKFITTLENSAYFKGVATRYTTRKKIKGKDTNEFELVCPAEGAKKK